MKTDQRTMSRYKQVKFHGRRIQEHRLIIEKIIGRILKPFNIVHHRDKDGFNNDNNNFIVCENEAYHNLIETRESAYRATKDSNKRTCVICGQYDSLDNLREKKRLGNRQSNWVHRS